jgi:hypothetical protein
MTGTTFTGLTPYRGVNELLFAASEALAAILGDAMIGFYLTGSLTYDDFIPGRSDIDLLVVVRAPLATKAIKKIEYFHFDLERRFPAWRERMECSYLPVAELKKIIPPEMPRPYMGGGRFYAEANYGNEWIINQYFLYKYGITLAGAEFKTISNPIHINDVKRACVADLNTEWEAKADDHEWLENSHYQSYLVLNLCRILHTVVVGDAVSKTFSALWVQRKFPEWSGLVQTAMDWEYGKKMNRKELAIEFLRFVIKNVNNSAIYKSGRSV